MNDSHLSADDLKAMKFRWNEELEVSKFPLHVRELACGKVLEQYKQFRERYKNTNGCFALREGYEKEREHGNGEFKYRKGVDTLHVAPLGTRNYSFQFWFKRKDVKKPFLGRVILSVKQIGVRIVFEATLQFDHSPFAQSDLDDKDVVRDWRNEKHGGRSLFLVIKCDQNWKIHIAGSSVPKEASEEVPSYDLKDKQNQVKIFKEYIPQSAKLTFQEIWEKVKSLA